MLALPIMSVAYALNIEPQDTIRLRVIPNSNTIRDRAIKHQVRQVIESDLAKTLAEVNDLKKARKITKDRIPVLEQDINYILRSNNIRHNATVEYGMNYLPRTSGYGVIFPAGYYESIIVTIGRGRGANWWCILFPPHCLIEARESEKIEYRSFFKDIISRLNR